MLSSTSDPSNPENDIAIVGMALRVPGARNVSEFWANLRAGVESIRRLDDEELKAAGETRARLRHPNYVRATADLPDMEMFDAEFFGLSPKEAAIMDPQHRHFLECAWEAMEDAARPPASIGGPVGVFAGCGMGSYFYFHVCSHRELVNSVGMFLLRHTGNDKDFLATRVSYAFDLRGPSVNVQTACSTSLVSVHYACQSLLARECDMALAGGATIELPHRRGYVFQDGEILSPDGHCHAFDDRAAGTVFGSGVGVVALRRLEDALADGDPIHAVIKATAVNNDGSEKAGYLAPSVSGQSSAIVEAHALANIDADTIQYVECHGTGTYLGDPIEVEALSQAFRKSTDRRGFCRIGSVKTNIGHLDTAAGVVSLIKATLALEHGEIPPTLGFETPNRNIDFASSPFLVNDRLTPWPEVDGKRRAGVNSLGVGGTNAHAILEEAPPRGACAEKTDDEGPELLLITAKSKKALDEARSLLADRLERDDAPPLRDVGYTLFRGRKHFERRCVLAVECREEAVRLLRHGDPRRLFTHTSIDAPAPTFLFPGGGAQYPGMARDLYDAEPEFREAVDEGLSYLPDEVATEVRQVWLARDLDEETAAKRFLKPSLQLPAILIVEVAIARLFIGFGVKPTALIGHSMGENAAACVAGVMGFRDAVRLVHLRGTLFDRIKDGGMLSVPIGREALLARLPDTLDLATVNAPELSVVSGPRERIDEFRATLLEEGIEARDVAIDIAAHSRLLDPILAPFEEFLRDVPLAAPEIPIVSNRTGSFLSDADARDPAYWTRHLRETVLFADGIATLAADPSRIYIEVGPGRALSSLVKAHGVVPANQVLNSLRHADEPVDDLLHFLTCLGRAYAVGIDVDLTSLWDPADSRKVSLPAYPFQHQRYFLDRVEVDEARGADAELEKHADPSTWGYRPIWRQSVAAITEGDDKVSHRILVFLDDAGLGPRLVSRLRSLGHSVVTVAPGDTFAKIGEDEYLLSPEHGREGYDALVRSLLTSGKAPDRIAHLWLVTADESFRPGSSFFHRNQERGFYSLLFLAQAFGDESATRPLHVTMVTNGMQRVADEPLLYPEKSTVLGPSQVAPRELPGLTCRVVDVTLPEARPHLFGGRLRMALADPFAGRRAIDQALEDLTDAVLEDVVADPDNAVVARRAGRRWVRDYRPLSLPDPEVGARRLRDGGVYLVTGGFGDLALVMAEELARRSRAKLVLVSRLQLPDRSQFQAYLRDHGQTERVGRAIAAIQRLESLGAEVLPICADVSNPEQMRDALSVVSLRFGDVHGVLHTAGIVRDELIQLKSLADIEEVFSPKVHGTAVLHELLSKKDLDFFVLFSSTSADTAPAGQVDYVAANAFMNAYAESRANDPKTRTIALHWGVFNQVGLAARALRQEAREGSEDRLRPTREGLFDRWVEDASGTTWLESTLSAERHFFLDEHRTHDGDAVLPGAGYFELIRQARAEYDQPLPFEVEDLLFLRPLHTPEGATVTTRARIERGNQGDVFTVKSACAFEGKAAYQRHAQATVRALAAERPAPLDLNRIRMRCDLRRREASGDALDSAQEAHLRFGPRWRVLKSTAFGRDEAIATLELPTSFVGDIEAYPLHPALIDLATGFAMELIEGYEPSSGLWVPISYRRARVYAELPARIQSWVRNAGANRNDEDFATFDVVIANDHGDVLFEIEGFTIKRLDRSRLALQDPESHEVELEGIRAPLELSPSAARLAMQVEQGILPSEGAAALMRVLGLDGVPQPIVSSMDLSLLRQKADDPPRIAEATNRFERPDLDSEYVAPRDEVEQALVGFWEELLGVTKVGVHDGFFDLGGHSLIAVRLFAMVRKTFGVDFPISVLFEAPTVESCAAKIRATRKDDEQAAPETPAAHFRHLVAMHPVEGKRKTPFFLCAGMFGNVLNLRHLAHLLGTDRPFYGLQARGLYGDQRPHETFEEMARDYLEEVRRVQPRGPYLLGGFSGGGITAYEMALQLEAQGEEVPLLVMLDTPLPTQPDLTMRDRAEIQLARMRRDGLRYAATWAKSRLDWELKRLRARFEEPEPLPAERFHNEAIEAAFRAALLRYSVESYDGHVTLFRPKLPIAYELSGNRMLNATREFLYEDNGWAKHVRDLTVYEVPGDHDGMVLEPNVRVLAAKLRACIERAEGEAQRLRVAAE